LDLVQTTEETFYWVFYLPYWAFHFQNFNLIFFRIFRSLLNSSFISCVDCLISFNVCLCSLWTHSGIYTCYL
jgi:hypothetical protein